MSDDIGNANQNDKVYHSTYRIVSGTLNQIIAPTAVTDVISTGFDNTERFAATSHADCKKYWLIAQGKNRDGFYAFLVDSDNTPTAFVNSPLPSSPASLSQINDGNVEQGYIKFSPDGSKLAWADSRTSEIHIHDFDNSNGTIIYRHSITGIAGLPYGLEFSPDSKQLFFSILHGPYAVCVHTISNGGPKSYDSTMNVFTGSSNNDNVGAIQLAPNGSLYVKYLYQSTLMEIQNPNLGLGATIVPAAIDAITGSPITLNQAGGKHGLPTFTRIADACLSGTCETIAEEVNDITSERADNDVNYMRPCEGRRRPKPRCREYRARAIRPHIEIKWGDSECDCIESDDTETVSITVCNPYSNIAFSGFTIHKLEVVDANGDPVATLPDGTPSVELTPIGPYCFGTVESCSCVSREFVLRNRGAISGEYHIRATGICYDVNLHFDDEACFKFDVCQD